MAEIIVTNLNDSGAGSLRQALDQANAATDSDTIRFSDALNGQAIKLLSPLQITQGKVQIIGNTDQDGEALITISGDRFNPNLISPKLLNVAAPADVALRNLVLSDGSDDRRYTPGVITNEGNLSIFDSTITRNTVGGGGGNSVYLGGTDRFDGAVLANLGGQLSIFDTVFTDTNAIGSAVTTSTAPDGVNSVAGILNTGDGLLSIDRVGFGGDATGGMGYSFFRSSVYGDGGDGVVGILAVNGFIQGNGGLARIGIEPTAEATGGRGGYSNTASPVEIGSPGVGVLGVSNPNNAVSYINAVRVGVSGTQNSDDIGDGTSTTDQVILGFGGADTLSGGRGLADELFGGAGDDVLNLFEGGFISEADFAAGARPTDNAFGGQGDDIIVLTSGGLAARSHYIDGGEGSDQISVTSGDFPSGVSSDLAREDLQRISSNATIQLHSVENAAGAGFDDLLTGDEVSNQLFGGGGNDTLNGLGGDDMLFGGDGINDVDGGEGVDTIVFTRFAGEASFSRSGDAIRVATADGESFVSNVEVFQFTDQSLSLADVEALIPTPSLITLPAVRVDITLTEADGDLARTLTRSNTTVTIDSDISDPTFTYVIDGSQSPGEAIEVIITPNGFDLTDVTFGGEFTGDQLDAELSVINTNSGSFTALNFFTESADLTQITNFFIRLDGDDFPSFRNATQYNDFLGTITSFGQATGAFAPNQEIALASFPIVGISEKIIGTSGADRLTGTQQGEAIDGGSGGDTISAGGGADLVTGGGGRDLISGQGGADTIEGGGGKDTLNGNGGKDMLDGGGGKDQLVGNGGKDMLDGGGGRDMLFGGGGKDTVEGGRGADQLSGGGGRDMFVFKTGSGRDKVLDYKDRLDKFMIERGASDFSDLSIVDLGDDAQIRFSNVRITVEDTDHRVLDASDFVFG